MLRRIAFGALGALLGYPLGALGGGYLIYLTSGNQHDPSVEAAMTGAFVTGPLLAVIGFIGGIAWAGPRSSRPK